MLKIHQHLSTLISSSERSDYRIGLKQRLITRNILKYKLQTNLLYNVAGT